MFYEDVEDLRMTDESGGGIEDGEIEMISILVCIIDKVMLQLDL